MASQQELSGILVLNQISENLTTPVWKTIVCEEQSTINGASAVTEKKTKCKNFSSTSTDATKVNGSGVNVGALSGSEMSYARMQQLRDANTPILFRRQNAASSTLLTGELTYAMFVGHISDVTETSTTQDVVSFTWTVVSTGVVDWNYAS